MVAAGKIRDFIMGFEGTRSIREAGLHQGYAQLAKFFGQTLQPSK